MTTAATLPPPSVIEPLDFERILATSKAHLLGHYPEAADTLALESSPLTKLRAFLASAPNPFGFADVVSIRSALGNGAKPE